MADPDNLVPPTDKGRGLGDVFAEVKRWLHCAIGYLIVESRSTDPTQVADHVLIYGKNDKVYKRTAAGTVTEIGADVAASAVSSHAALTSGVHGFDGSGNAPAQAHAIDGAKHTGITGTTGNFMALTATGLPVDSTKSPSSFDAAGAASGAVGTHESTYAHANLPSADQKAALAGTSGTPSVTNKYLTNADSRNSDARTPTAHAASHVAGDAIQSATAVQIGLMTTAYAGKLDGISAGADVTATALPGAIHAATAKTPLVDADELPLADSEATYGLKHVLWSAIKSTLKTYFDTLYTALSWSALTDPTANKTINFANYTATQQIGATGHFRFGDGAANYCDFGANGAETFSGLGKPKKRIFFSSSAGVPRLTSGCNDAAQIETTTNKVNNLANAFPKSADSYWQGAITLPENYDGGDLTAAIEWTPDSDCTSGGVCFYISAMAIHDDAALDTAFGSAVKITDTMTTIGDLNVTAKSGAITPGGTHVGGDKLWIQIYRDVDDVADTLTGGANNYAQFIGVWLTFAVDALSSED